MTATVNSPAESHLVDGAVSQPNTVARTRRPRRGRRILTTGPAFVAAVAYVDPGNVATNVSAGSSYGLALLWIVVLATLMAAPVQYLSSKLGTTTGRSLPEHIVGRMGRRGRAAFRLQAGLVAVATDVAELVGAAVGLHLLFGTPLLLGCVIAAVVSLLVLQWRDRCGARGLEVLCVGTLLLMGAGLAAGLLPSLSGAGPVLHTVVPRLGDEEMLLLAVGIVGATIMPHAVYLHSGLSAERVRRPGTGSAGADRPAACSAVGRTSITRQLKTTRWDVGAAMLAAGTVNIALLVLGAVALPSGVSADFVAVSDGIREGAGQLAGYGFGIALLASGLTSSAVGAHAGSVMLTGLFDRRSGMLLRRMVTVLPAMALLLVVDDPMRGLVLSQVVLALGLPLALIPLVRLTSRRSVMGVHVDVRLTAAVAAVTAAVLALDAALIAFSVS